MGQLGLTLPTLTSRPGPSYVSCQLPGNRVGQLVVRQKKKSFASLLESQPKYAS